MNNVEINDMLAATGFMKDKTFKLSRASGGNQAYVFNPQHQIILNKSLSLYERQRAEARTEFSPIARNAWRSGETYDSQIPDNVMQIEAVNLLDAYNTELDEIPVGGANPTLRNLNASKYHWLIFNILSIIFRNRLKRPQMEEQMGDGLQYVDITFSNKDDVGFFNQLAERYDIRCPNIMIECKNYTDDIRNPAYHQIESRLGRQSGRFGIIICRDIEDVDLALERSTFIHRQRSNIVITLTDSEIKELVELKLEDDDESIDYYLEDKLKKIIYAP